MGYISKIGVEGTKSLIGPNRIGSFRKSYTEGACSTKSALENMRWLEAFPCIFFKITERNEQWSETGKEGGQKPKNIRYRAGNKDHFVKNLKICFFAPPLMKAGILFFQIFTTFLDSGFHGGDALLRNQQ